MESRWVFFFFFNFKSTTVPFYKTKKTKKKITLPFQIAFRGFSSLVILRPCSICLALLHKALIFKSSQNALPPAPPPPPPKQSSEYCLRVSVTFPGNFTSNLFDDVTPVMWCYTETGFSVLLEHLFSVWCGDWATEAGSKLLKCSRIFTGTTPSRSFELLFQSNSKQRFDVDPHRLFTSELSFCSLWC